MQQLVPAYIPANKVHQITRTQEYFAERSRQLQDDLKRLGIQNLNDADIRSKIDDGHFVHNGCFYQYNLNSGHYEKTTQESSSHRPIGIHNQHKEKNTEQQQKQQHTIFEHSTSPQFVLKISEEQYRSQLRSLQEELYRLGYGYLTEYEYNSTMASGGFTHNGQKYTFNSNTRRYETVQQNTEVLPSYSQVRPASNVVTIQLTSAEYVQRFSQLKDALKHLGYGPLSPSDYNTTIASGGFVHNSCKYLYNAENRRYEKTDQIEIVGQAEYQEFYNKLQNKLRELDVTAMGQLETNYTLSTGQFVRGGAKYKYNGDTGNFERYPITDAEEQQIFQRIKEILRRFGYRQISQREQKQLLDKGSLIRGGYQWFYSSKTGTLEKCDFVGDFAELSKDEYNRIYQKIQETLNRLNYEHMNAEQCNETIKSGTFERGGIYWVYNAETEEFEQISLGQMEFRDRVILLRQEMKRLGLGRELSPEEYRAIVYKGYFYYGGYRYEFNSKAGRYERIELGEKEYTEHLSKLLVKLDEIGYRTMSQSEQNSTIINGAFQFGGYEWLYNFDSGSYNMGRRLIPSRNRTESIDENRGDQPPQHFNEDYESEEILEVEPGLGYYAIDKKPEIGLAPPDTFNQQRSIATTTDRPIVSPNFITSQSEYEKQQYEKEHILLPSPPVPQRTEYERRYHRTQTTYSQTMVCILSKYC